MSFIALLDYGMGNLLSVSRALEAAGGSIRIVSTPADASGAAGVILPGVGNFGDGMKNLKQAGFVPFLKDWVREDRPLMGICLGMQMMLDSSEEAPGTEGLSLFHGKVLRFPANGEKVPQIGWNSAVCDPSCKFLKNVEQNTFFYFVHSFYVLPDDPENSVMKTEYDGVTFTSALSLGNIFATQFHPEKSQKAGIMLLRNFVEVVHASCTISI